MATWHRQQFDEGASISEASTHQVAWVAAGVTSVSDALTDGNFPVVYNQAHPDFSAFKARNIRINARGFQVFGVTADYAIPANGGTFPEEDDLTKPSVYNWQTVQQTIAVDRDATSANNGLGNAITSSVGRFIEGVSVPKNYKRLTITKWLSSFDVNRAFNYENTVNSVAYEGANPGEVKCATIQPNSSFPLPITQIGVDHTFDFKPKEKWGDQPWQLFVKDQDSAGYADGKVRRFVTSEGEPYDNVPLNGSGQPIDSSVTYLDNGTPVDSPSWESQTTPPGATVVTVGSVKFLRYATLLERNFSALGL